jgi:hypothetical protein
MMSDTWEENGLKVFENRMMRNVYLLNKEKETGG